MNNYKVLAYFNGLPVIQPNGSVVTCEHLRRFTVTAPNPWAAIREKFTHVDVKPDVRGRLFVADAYGNGGRIARILVRAIGQI